MALVDSLLTAMVRADGDALVMHVGERPYVVVGAGTLDLSTQTLNLDGMTGMLQQLLPQAAQESLAEFGAVEHRLPPLDTDAFTMVAARGGDDIWIEIRRRRNAPAVAAAAPAALAEPAVAIADEPVPDAELVASVAASPLMEVFAVIDTAPAEIPEPAAIMTPAEVDPPAEEEASADVASLAEFEPLIEDVAEAPASVTPVEEAPLGPAPVAAGPVVTPVAEPPIADQRDIALLEELLWPRKVDEAPAPLEPAEPLERVEPAEPAEPTLAPVLQMLRTVHTKGPARPAAPRASRVERLLRLAASRAASVLFLTSESSPSIRVEGDVRSLDDEPPLTRAQVEAAVMEIVPAAEQEAVGRGESAEWIAEFADLGRIRCLTFTDHRGPGVVFRMIATRAATAEQLGLSPEVKALATEPQGLVLVAGTRGTGKSTILSALVDLVNRQRAEYVITLEREIRLVHENRAAIVSQREIRGGVAEALDAAHTALREDPDVLVVDDLASAQMVPLLLQAAAEGLVFVSITAQSTTEAVERFVDLAPAELRAGVQAAMAETFRGAVAQVLLKKTGGGRVAAREVLLATAAVTRVISDGVPGQLQVALEGGHKHGMVSLADALVSLVHSGVVDVREAFRKSPDRARLLAGLKREGIDTSVVDRLA